MPISFCDGLRVVTMKVNALRLAGQKICIRSEAAHGLGAETKGAPGAL